MGIPVIIEESMTIKVPIDSIKISQDRRKTNPEKVAELAESIKEIGLLNPITISDNYDLIAGLYRLEAYKLLGCAEIEANIVSLDGLLAELAEIDENLMREELHYIDRGNRLKRRQEIYEKLYPGTKATTGKELVNKRWNTTAPSASVKKPPFVIDMAMKMNKSETTVREDLRIAKKIVPEVQKVIKENNITKKEALKLAQMESEKQKMIAEKITDGKATSVRTAIIAINNERAEELKNNPLEVSSGKFQTIEIDPPWKLDGQEAKSQVLQYPLMDLRQIKDLGEKINEMADENCHLYLWVINPMLPEAIEVLKSWEKYGFIYKTCITWVKSNGFGTGHYYRGQTEHVLFAVKGKLGTDRNNQPNYFEAPRYKHSEKPEKFYEIVETMSPEPRLRLFARSHREGWKSWGDEA